MAEALTTASTLVSALAAAAAGPLGRFVFVDRREQERVVALAEVWERAERSAGRLAAAGVRAGDRVAIILPTGPAFMDALFGAQRLGAIPVPLYPPVRLGRLDEYVDRTAAMLQVCEAAVIVSDRRVRRLLGSVVARYRPPLGVLAAESLASGPIPRGDMPGPAPDDIALVQFSSGTTRAPHGVMLTHRQVLANTDAIITVFPAETNHPTAGATWLPLYHDMGLIGCVFVAVRLARPLALLPPELFLARPALWLRAIGRHRAVVSPAPNFAYARCVEKVKDEELEGVDLDCWRLAMNGAEPVSPRTCADFTRRFARWGLRPTAITPVYGLSEAALAVTFADRDTPMRARALAGATEVVPSTGRPLPGYQVEVRDRVGSSIAAGAGAVGRIWISGPSVMAGYLGEAPSPVVDGWLDTGDLGALVDGELYVTGRAKDMIKLHGRGWAPQDIERCCEGVPGVRPGCVVAVGDVDAGGERLVLFVEYRERDPALEEGCCRAVRGALGLDPAEVVALAPGTLPRTSSGKLRRAEALRQWRDGTLGPPRRVTPWLLAGAMAKSRLDRWRSR